MEIVDNILIRKRIYKSQKLNKTWNKGFEIEYVNVCSQTRGNTLIILTNLLNKILEHAYIY